MGIIDTEKHKVYMLAHSILDEYGMNSDMLMELAEAFAYERMEAYKYRELFRSVIEHFDQLMFHLPDELEVDGVELTLVVLKKRYEEFKEMARYC